MTTSELVFPAALALMHGCIKASALFTPNSLSYLNIIKLSIFTFVSALYQPIPIWMPANEPDRNTRRRIEDILRSDKRADLYAPRDVTPQTPAEKLQYKPKNASS